ncbi:MAG: 2OG-Fe(II) oxygenase [Acidimicrobiia bacterium]|nr:2OG-Fe(II) oxygenase [Acidimicrobiia bacterium]
MGDGAVQTRDVFGAWVDDTASLVEHFRTAKPFPLVVIDGFLRDDLADAILGEFPALEDMPKSRDYVFADKHEFSDLDRFGPAGAKLSAAFLSDEFAAFLSELTGERIFVDPDYHGGGFHQSGDGGYLDMHVDFNVHPLHRDWLRMLNVLVYLNRDWRPEYAGELLIKNSPHAEPRAISPDFNRAVIMVTNESTYHGFHRMSLPDGVTRKSVAAYGYRSIEPDEVDVRTTQWRPEAAGLSKKMLARNYDTIVRVKNRWFGSGTSKHR